MAKVKQPLEENGIHRAKMWEIMMYALNNTSTNTYIMKRWTEKNGVTITSHEDLDIDSFKTAVDGIDDWFVNELKAQNYEDAEALVAAFRK